jgi:hypothetical protein
MANEDRIAALRKRVHHTESGVPMQVSTTPITHPQQPVQKKERQRDRARHTLYLDKHLVKQVDQAFKEAAHALYPKEIEKADYLEACLTYALAHQDEIQALLASNPTYDR